MSPSSVKEKVSNNYCLLSKVTFLRLLLLKYTTTLRQNYKLQVKFGSLDRSLLAHMVLK